MLCQKYLHRRQQFDPVCLTRKIMVGERERDKFDRFVRLGHGIEHFLRLDMIDRHIPLSMDQHQWCLDLRNGVNRRQFSALPQMAGWQMPPRLVAQQAWLPQRAAAFGQMPIPSTAMQQAESDTSCIFPQSDSPHFLTPFAEKRKK
jgi:hypothetical protein